MPEPVDEMTDSIRRALDAAEAANEAAQDMANLSASHRSFADAVMAGQRRNTLFAVGAAAGALVAIAVCGLVYFRSVADLRIASAVQSEAAALLVDQLTRLDEIGDLLEAQQETMRSETLTLLEKVKDEIRRAAMETQPQPAAEEAALMSAQIANDLREGMKADLDAARDEVLQAIVETKMSGGGGNEEVAALVTAVKAMLARAEAAPAPAPAAPARTTRPQRRPAAAPEPDPFAYP